MRTCLCMMLIGVRSSFAPSTWKGGKRSMCLRLGFTGNSLPLGWEVSLPETRWCPYWFIPHVKCSLIQHDPTRGIHRALKASGKIVFVPVCQTKKNPCLLVVWYLVLRTRWCSCYMTHHKGKDVGLLDCRVNQPLRPPPAPTHLLYELINS